MIEEIVVFLETGNWRNASRSILHRVLQPTHSEFGFVGVILHGEILRVLFHEGFRWHETANREFFETKMQGYQRDGYLDFEESNNLVAAVVKQKRAVLSNSPATDPRSGGIPAGHPPLHCFLGVPAVRQEQVVGIIGVANRQGGYREDDKAVLERLTSSVIGLYDCYCRVESDRQLRKTTASGS